MRLSAMLDRRASARPSATRTPRVLGQCSDCDATTRTSSRVVLPACSSALRRQKPSSASVVVSTSIAVRAGVDTGTPWRTVEVLQVQRTGVVDDAGLATTGDAVGPGERDVVEVEPPEGPDVLRHR